MDLTFICTSYY